MYRSVVECYAGSSYPERPRSFLWEGTWVAVEEVLRQWHIPNGLVFQVRAANGFHFNLTYLVTADAWIIEQTN